MGPTHGGWVGGSWGCSGKTHRRAVSVVDAKWKCRERPMAVMLLVRCKDAVGSRLLDCLRGLLGYPQPPSSVPWVTRKKTDDTAFGVNNWVGGPVCS